MLVTVAREHFSLAPWSLRLHIRRSRTDTAGQGAVAGIWCGDELETCTVRRLEAWL